MNKELPKHLPKLGLALTLALALLTQCEETKQEPIPTATAHAIESDMTAVEGILAIVITQEPE